MSIRLSVGGVYRARDTDERRKLLSEPFGNIPQPRRFNFGIDMLFGLPPERFAGRSILENGSVH